MDDSRPIRDGTGGRIVENSAVWGRKNPEFEREPIDAIFNKPLMEQPGVETHSRTQNWVLKCCDAREGMENLSANSVDLIFTDPPYEYDTCISCCQILADEGPRVLKPGGSLVTLVGHKTVPAVTQILSECLQYRWMFAMLQTQGQHAQLRNSGVEVTWKPALWYSNGSISAERLWSRMNIMKDGIEMHPAGEGTQKTHHQWEQTKQWSDYYIPRLAFEDEVVLDPFMGSGTFVLSAVEAGCVGIGMDVEQESWETARERLS